jgi:hypothetical protein
MAGFDNIISMLGFSLPAFDHVPFVSFIPRRAQSARFAF